MLSKISSYLTNEISASVPQPLHFCHLAFKRCCCTHITSPSPPWPPGRPSREIQLSVFCRLHPTSSSSYTPGRSWLISQLYMYICLCNKYALHQWSLTANIFFLICQPQFILWSSFIEMQMLYQLWIKCMRLLFQSREGHSVEKIKRCNVGGSKRTKTSSGQQ